MKSQSTVSIKTLYPFVAMTFILTWGLASFFMIFSDHPILGRIIGEMSMKNPLYILAVYSPGFAGAFLVWRKFGLKGLGSFFKRLTFNKGIDLVVAACYFRHTGDNVCRCCHQRHFK